MTYVFEYDTKITENNPELFNYIQSSYMNYIVSYFINSNTRKAVFLTNWIREQVENPSSELLVIAQKIKENVNMNDYDSIVYGVFIYVTNRLQYRTDATHWKVTEYWATAEDTIKTWRGDCEDGACLIYVLCRLLGVPANRMLIFAGDVESPSNPTKTEGHAFLGYRSNMYPLNWVFMDWCYFVDKENTRNRHKYFINNKTIYGDNKYKSLWFAFNENNSYTELKNKYG
jgi:hypothetical protein